MQESVLRLRKVQFLRNSASVLQHSVKMFRLLVLISIIGCVELITVTTPQKYVNVTRGGSVLLQCMFVTTEQTNGLTIQWDFISPSSMRPQQVYYYQSGKDVITRSYEGRLQPPSSPGTTNNASVVISDMQPSDAGVYTCEVHNFPDVDGQSQANIIVNVLERPSAPYCSVHGDVESGHLVTLTCHSERGSPTPTYTWIRLDQTKTRRPVLGRMTKTGILEIRNISQFEFGEYQCNATNVVGFSTCTIELNHEVGDGVIAGAVIGALLGCVLIVLVVWFIAHTVKKHKYKAVKVSEANEMKRSPPQAQEASDSVPVATAASNLHAEGDEPQA
ncbi:V-set and immunoglobulin domain-containing protein 1-like isoform X1 [Siniperca chuatsi]|uniref:V-set and immunoglobulin domain-containing protein 1-like isoform X1 n=1 Tax=Siniperca chuatsi TaxID=119488 RepID=UPI001CE18A8F|nr:V-set and immunoglobulin domain-containing protein 1-like isoform X1 [Siniperca chuatsi]